MVTSGKLGTVERTYADLSIGSPPESSFEDSHRMVNPDLAGGALLDLGIYALTWVFQTLYTTQKNPKPPTVQSAIRKYEKTGVDQQTTMLLTFPRDKEGDAHGIATTGMRVSSDPSGKMEAPSIRIQGTKGELMVYPPAPRPIRTKLVLADGTVDQKDWAQPGPGKGSGFYNGFGSMFAEGEGMGMFWEADECAYALKEGRKEGKYESLDESLVIMKVMDEVRKQHGFKLPEKIETTDYPVDM
jgi:dihydrodiol dehydrogenase / D-xylose 1-dehydrogenase (NADP)